jgi:triacylglycerol lipase
MRTRLTAFAAASVAVSIVLGAASPAGARTAQASADPVVIVAGTFAGETAADVFYQPLAARLAADGRQSQIFGLPGSGLGDIRDTARELDAYVDRVLARTGASRVDIIGHSQGGLVARYYIKYLGGDSTVDSNISLGTPNHGTAVANLLRLLGLGTCLGVTACQQMAAGSAFLADLNAGDDTIGNVSYTNIATVFDEIVVPYTTAFLDNDGNNTNVTVQRPCFARFVGHVGLALDGTVYSGIQDALAHQPITLNCFAL